MTKLKLGSKMRTIPMTPREEDSQEQINAKIAVLYEEYSKAIKFFAHYDSDGFADNSTALGKRDAWDAIAEDLWNRLSDMGITPGFGADGELLEKQPWLK